MKKIIVLIVFSSVIFAKSNTEKIGDFLTFAIPTVAYGSTFYFDDAEGRTQFYKAYGTTMASTVALKYTVREKRPDNNDRDSFPSGHTASAISGATFMHRRYGWKRALPYYVAAIYTGYSRIQVNRHHPRDVAAGAVIAALASWYFVDAKQDFNLAPVVEHAYQGLSFSYRF